MIRLRILGPIELHDAHGRELASILAQPKRLALLVYLAAAPGFQRRDSLLALFWPELDDAHARAALNQAVRFLRRELGDTLNAVVVSRGVEELGIDRNRLWCDVTSFRDDIAERRLGEALQLYRADLLDGFHSTDAGPFQDWLDTERMALRAQAARAAREVAEQHERGEHFTTAVATARRAVELAGDDERALRELLQLLDRLGDRAGAIHAYEAFAAKLRVELDADPAAETVAAIAAIRGRQEPRAVREHLLPARAQLATAAPPEPFNSAAQERRWEVVRELGRGGSAIVYLARDRKHDRQVAFKALRPELAAAVGAERFLREIQITAQLAHPHILPLIDSGEQDGMLYFVTPYFPGESLRDRLVRDRALPLDEALRLASEIADALSYAHQRGIIHCDIKPENILVAGTHAVVADFGIARAAAAAANPRGTITGPAPFFGTPAYMSPEQRAGIADARTDLFALGVLLYESLAGFHPFAPTATGAFSPSHHRPTGVPLAQVRKDVPRALSVLIDRCLHPSPENRPHSASHLCAELATIARHFTARGALGIDPTASRRRLARAVALYGFVAATVVDSGNFMASRERSVAAHDGIMAVLPFSVRARDSSYAYLREGMIDLIHGRFAGAVVPRLLDARVILSAYRRAAPDDGELGPADAARLAARLGAATILTGEVVVTRGGITINGRIVDAKSHRVLAARSETGTDELETSARLADALLAMYLGETDSRLQALTASSAGMRAYLAGMHAYRAGRLIEAYGLFTRALDEDALFAPAAVRRAYVAWGAFVFGTPQKRSADSAAWALRNRLSPRDSLVLAALPSIGPNYPRASSGLELLLAQERAARANPDKPEIWTDWAHHLYGFGLQAGIPKHFSLAISAADSAIALDSSFVPALRLRHYLGVLTNDTPSVRRYERLLERIGDRNDPSHRWAGARLLGDGAAMSRLFHDVVARGGREVLNLELWAGHYGLATTLEAERAVIARLERPDLSMADKSALTASLWRLAAARGSLTRLPRLDTTWNPHAIHVAIAEPVFDAVIRDVLELAHRRSRTGTTESRAQALCLLEIWRAARGDTANTRRAIAALRITSARADPAPAWRVGGLGLCHSVLEAQLEHARGVRPATPALDHLERLVLSGTLGELPGITADLIATRLRAQLGQHAAALRLIRRRDPMSRLTVQPACWLLEAQLAERTGDSAGAIHAYRRYLSIRDMPDSRFMVEQDREVRFRLQALEARL